MRFSIICSSHNEEVLKKNLLSSKGIKKHDLIIKKNYSNVCKAYNEGMKEAKEDIVIFIHHDVFLPETFFEELTNSIKLLEGINWGVLGVAGVTITDNYGYLCDRGKIWGDKEKLPRQVDTLDELILIMKKDSLIFDENIPSSHHMFGADICLQARSIGLRNFAIKAYCEHNSSFNNILPPEFFKSVEYIKGKWYHMRPIRTTCTLIA